MLSDLSVRLFLFYFLQQQVYCFVNSNNSGDGKYLSFFLLMQLRRALVIFSDFIFIISGGCFCNDKLVCTTVLLVIVIKEKFVFCFALEMEDLRFSLHLRPPTFTCGAFFENV